jgi:predicted lipoprotein with Yx(FWY)xxD motif
MQWLLAATAITLAALIATGCSGLRAAAAPAEHTSGVLVDGSKGMTLYTYDKDPGNGTRSVCTGPCVTNWPPFAATAGDKAVREFATIKRDDGTYQWAYKGKPLYFWVNDQKPGDRTGDGFENLWRAAK